MKKKDLLLLIVPCYARYLKYRGAARQEDKLINELLASKE